MTVPGKVRSNPVAKANLQSRQDDITVCNWITVRASGCRTGPGSPFFQQETSKKSQQKNCWEMVFVAAQIRPFNSGAISDKTSSLWLADLLLRLLRENRRRLADLQFLPKFQEMLLNAYSSTSQN